MCKAEYINIKTGEKLDWNNVEKLKDNAILKLRPDLWCEWDFEKNNEIGIDIWKLTKGSSKKTWWICKDCHSSYDVRTTSKLKDVKCSYCSGRKVNHTNSLRATHPSIVTQWDYDKNGDKIPDNFRYGSHIKVWWKCFDCKSSYDMQINNKTIHNQGCPYCSGQKVNRTNCLTAVNPKLSEEWDYKLNSVTPNEITCGNKHKYWWKCRTCEMSYDATVYNRISGSNCPYCSGRKVKEEDSLKVKRPDLIDSWLYEKNSKLGLYIDKVSVKSNLKAWWRCENNHEWQTSICIRTNGHGCPYCAGQKVIKGVNDLWTTDSKTASMLINKDDGYNYSRGVDKKVDWLCPNCNSVVKEKSIASVIKKGLSCSSCGDGFSYPHKFMYNFLTTLGLEFEVEKSFKWTNRKRYDFYIPSLNMIIETHGEQHYIENGFKSVGGRTLKEEQENDYYKREIALQNGIKYYIELDCRESNMKYIRDSIMNSELGNLLDISQVEWKQVDLKSQKSMVVKSWSLYNLGLSKKDIAKDMKLHVATINNYIRRGKELGLINDQQLGVEKSTPFINA